MVILKNLDRKLLFEDVKKYVQCPAYYKESKSKLWHVLQKDFAQNSYFLYLDVAIPNENQVLVVKGNKESNLWLLVHVDRIILETSPDVFVFSEDYIKGRLDNSISIALLKQLQKEVNLNILFTTMEEHCKSVEQIVEFVKCEKLDVDNTYFIDVDIDVFDTTLSKVSKIKNQKGLITLRDKDHVGVFDKKLVNFLRDICDKNKLPWLNTQIWSLVQSGLLSYYKQYKTAYIGFPLVNYHTNNEIIFWDALDTGYNLLYFTFKQGVFKK